MHTAATIGSEEERRAILDAYTSSKGSLDTVFERVMASQILDDEERIREIIDKAIGNKEVEAFKSYINETTTSKKRRRKAARKEAKEAEEYAKELGVHEQLFGRAKSNDAEAEPKPRKRATRGKKTAEEDTSALEALIRSRQQNRMGHMIASLETKYGGSNKKGKRPLEDDKEFEVAQERLLKRGTKRGRQ
jgi:DnaJ family protein C protein 9